MYSEIHLRTILSLRHVIDSLFRPTRFKFGPYKVTAAWERGPNRIQDGAYSPYYDIDLSNDYQEALKQIAYSLGAEFTLIDGELFVSSDQRLDGLITLNQGTHALTLHRLPWYRWRTTSRTYCTDGYNT
ncbi:hypothetical protein [uncultured Umboniibacter sp.]|uniref:hypothetical protein n=1 Tax=uncultured Umboniibacter sp. TaxID=1798917 RepID=UPI00260A7219|nr:hypothetical protein [uncultured Umboniibacter sp.]